MTQSTIAVTGVASEIGAALARILKEQGHQVIGFDIRETADNVDRFIPLDLNDEDSIAAAAAAVHTPLDGLCNNAGLPPRAGLEEAILQVNFLGTRAFTNAVLPHLRDGGSLVNMASRAGHGWLEGAALASNTSASTLMQPLAQARRKPVLSALYQFTRCSEWQDRARTA
ncbi:MAG: SDR family NAD(P)-dependent oxidoreductase [Paracoccaceae bacterium]